MPDTTATAPASTAGLNIGSAAATAAPAHAPAKPEQMTRKLREPVPADRQGWWWGTGRRKTSVARVRLRPARGDGSIKVQLEGKDKFKTVEVYFAEERDRNDCYAPLKVTNTFGKMDVVVRIHGGGFMGQAQSVRLGIARALRNYDPTLEGALRDEGFLTRDPREVERKKYGQAGARRRFQFSKR
jgi:small subunit ribosomal protein S9